MVSKWIVPAFVILAIALIVVAVGLFAITG
jgi:hypothetical protein